MPEETIRNIRDRIQRCRWLAKPTTDERTATALRLMADEIEADVKCLGARRIQAWVNPTHPSSAATP